MLKMASNGTRVTLAVLGQRLNDLHTLVVDNTADVKEIRQILSDRDIRLDRLEQTDKIKRRHLGYVWGALSLVGAERALNWISSLPR